MRVFCGLLLVLMVDAWLQMPLNSNHTIIKNFLLLAMLIGGARQLWRGGTWSDFYADFAPVGRVLLVVMYVFGIFHKLNRDFLDPMVSCAVVLWRAMPAPLGYLDSAPVHLATIYGTFLAEGLILLPVAPAPYTTLGHRRRHRISLAVGTQQLRDVRSIFNADNCIAYALRRTPRCGENSIIASLAAVASGFAHHARVLVLSVWLGLMIFSRTEQWVQRDIDPVDAIGAAIGLVVLEGSTRCAKF